MYYIKDVSPWDRTADRMADRTADCKKQNATLVDYIAQHFECGLGEAEEYIDILREKGTRGVLYSMGIEDKEINKLLKKWQKTQTSEDIEEKN